MSVLSVLSLCLLVSVTLSVDCQYLYLARVLQQNVNKKVDALSNVLTLLYITQGNLGPASRLLCGLGAGVSEAILAVTPMETIKAEMYTCTT